MFKHRGALRGRELEGRRKRPCLLGQGTGDAGMGPSTGSPVRRKTSVLQEEEGAGRGGSQTRPPGPGVPPMGAVGVWKAVAGRGTRETGEGAEGPDAASGCLADIQRQCG